MGLSATITYRSIDRHVFAERRLRNTIRAFLPMHEVSATLRYDPSFPYPDVGMTPRNVTVGFIQNLIGVETWVQFRGRDLIHEDCSDRLPLLDSAIFDTGSGSDPAWLRDETTRGSGAPAFTSFTYGPDMTPPASSYGTGLRVPLATAGSVGSSPPSTWTVGSIGLEDTPAAAYFQTFRGQVDGEPLEHARRELRFRIWICMLPDGASPSVASNYHILAQSDVFMSGHRVTMTGDGYASGTGGDIRCDSIVPVTEIGFAPVVRGVPSGVLVPPVVSGTRAMDFSDGLSRLGASPDIVL